MDTLKHVWLHVYICIHTNINGDPYITDTDWHSILSANIHSYIHSYTYIHVYLLSHIYTCIHTHSCLSACIQRYLHAYIMVFMHLYIYIYIYILCIHTSKDSWMCVHAITFSYIQVHKIHACQATLVHTCMNAYIDIHTYTFMHVYLHWNINMHTIYMYIYTFKHICLCAYILINIHSWICVHASIHTCMHTHIGTYISVSLLTEKLPNIQQVALSLLHQVGKANFCVSRNEQFSFFYVVWFWVTWHIYKIGLIIYSVLFTFVLVLYQLWRLSWLQQCPLPLWFLYFCCAS